MVADQVANTKNERARIVAPLEDGTGGVARVLPVSVHSDYPVESEPRRLE